MCSRFARPVSPEKPDKSSLYDGMSGTCDENYTLQNGLLNTVKMKTVKKIRRLLCR